MFVEEYWKLVIGTTLGVCLLIFGAVFWESATEDYYNKLNGVTYEIDSCLQYMEPPLGSIADRDECLQKRQIGVIFLTIGTFILGLTMYTNKHYFSTIMNRKR